MFARMGTKLNWFIFYEEKMAATIKNFAHALDNPWLPQIEQCFTNVVENQSLLQKVLVYSPIKEAYCSANKVALALTNKNLIVLAASPGVIPRNGECRLYEGQVQIVIDARLTERGAITVLIQELANAIFMLKCKDLYERIHEISKDFFVREIEYIEFQALQLYNGMIKQLKSGWPEDWSSFSYGFTDFSSFFERQKEAGHTRIYEDLWCKKRENLLIFG